jgi:hypothetical protein
MDHVVDLVVLLAGAGPDVGGAVGEAFEAADVALAQIQARHPLRDPFRRRPTHAGGVRDPDRLGDPEAVDLPGLADQGIAVRGEGEEPVDGILDPGLGQLRHEGGRVSPGVLEVLFSEGHQGGHPGCLRRIGDVLGPDRERDMLIGADPVRLPPLPEVQSRVLVA